MSSKNLAIQTLCTAAELAQATGGNLVQGLPRTSCQALSTDSRQAAPGSLFVALKGENFDGARFCSKAVSGGARVVLVERKSWEGGVVGPLAKDVAVVVVPDSLKALGDLASWHRQRFHPRVVGITGSNGKTSTKQMVVAVLGGPAKVLFNRGNLNNLVGMPRALMELREEHAFVVMEMGMNAPGEILRLAQIAKPQVGVITNVHPVHLAGLGSIQAVAEAKGELFASLPEDGTAVVNLDDPYVLKNAGRIRANQVTFGRSPNADVRLLQARQEASGLVVDLCLLGQNIQATLGRPGQHNACNAAAAAAVGVVEGKNLEEISAGLAATQFPRLRMERVDLGRTHLLVDCYNANPRSVQAALQALSELASGHPAFAILGDMRELGESSANLHQQVGQAAASVLQGLCAFGSEAREIARGAREAGLGEVVQTQSVEEAAAWVREKLQDEHWILVKGSRAMRLERIVEALAQESGIGWNWEHED